MSIRLKLGMLLTTLFLAAIGNSLLTFKLEAYGEEKLKWVIHTHEVLIESERLMGDITNAETGQRGYLLTQNTEYLEPYHTGMKASEEHLKNLVKLTSDNPNQQRRLKEIRILIGSKSEELNLTIKLTQDNTPSSLSKSLEIVKSNSGKKFMDAIRLKIAEFKNEELLLLEQRKGELKESRAYILAFVVFEVLFFLFMAMMTLMFIRNKFYQPLEMLISGTEKMEMGIKQEVSDIMPKDEMGYLLSRFYKMSCVIYEKSQQLMYEASHDALTGLKNRKVFETDLEEKISSLAGDSKLSLFFIDINKFKEMNDTLGHDAGDAVLVETASRLENSVRKDDTVYRLAGDEFIVLLTDISKVSDAKKMAEKLVNNFDKGFVYQGKNIDISLSIGVSISPDDTIDSGQLIKYADIAMYAAKCNGGTNYMFFNKSMLQRESDQ